MKTILSLIERKLVRPMESISQQRHLAAVRNGLLAVFPLSLIGSIFYFVATLPLPEGWAVQRFLERHANTILIPYRMTVVLVTLYMVVGVGASLARFYKMDPVTGAVVALAAFLMTTVPVRPAALVPISFVEEAVWRGMDTSWYNSLSDLGWVMPQTPMSGIGMYVGAFSAILGVEAMHLNRWLTRKTRKAPFWKKTLVPKAVVQAVDTILPIAIVVVFLFVVRDILGFDFQGVILSLFDKIIRSSSTLSGSLVYVLVLSLFSFFGIVGFGVSGSAAGVAWASLLAANQAAHAAGTVLPNVAPLPFFHYFVWIGGTGATLGIVIMMCFSKSSYLKKLGLSCLVPSLTNINQPAIYGLPVILNPYMLIPFILAPQITTLVTYACMQLNLVARPYANPSGSLPFAVGAFLSTGDWKAILLSIANLCITMMVYYPFFKMYEKKLISEGARKAKQHAINDKNKPKVTTVE